MRQKNIFSRPHWLIFLCLLFISLFTLYFLDIIYDQICRIFQVDLTGIDHQIIIQWIAPCPAGIIIIISLSGYIFFYPSLSGKCPRMLLLLLFFSKCIVCINEDMITVRCICKYCICTASQEYSSEFICKSVDQCCLLFIHLIIVRDDIASDSKSAEETAVTARHLICFFQNAFHIQIAISDFLCCQIYDLSVITAHLHLLCKNLCNFSPPLPYWRLMVTIVCSLILQFSFSLHFDQFFH